MIAPEYFNNHVSVEGEIIVKSVPNDAGFVLVWNPTTKKISRRTHAEIATDLGVLTDSSWNNITGKKWFYTSGGYAEQNHSLSVRSTDGSYPGIAFWREGVDVGNIVYTGDDFAFLKNDTGTTAAISAAGFYKSGSDNNYLLLGGGGHKLVSDFALTTDLTGYVTINTSQEIEARKVFRPGTGNTYDTALLELRGSNTNGIYPTLSFHVPGFYAATLSFRSNGFNFMSANADSLTDVNAAKFIKGGSNDSYVLLGGGGHKNVSDFASNNYIDYTDDRIITPSDIPSKKIQYGFTSWDNNNSYPYADFLHFGGYQDGSGGNQNLIMFNKNGFGFRQYQSSPQNSNLYTDYIDYWHTGNFNQGYVDEWVNKANEGIVSIPMLQNQLINYVTINTPQTIIANKNFAPTSAVSFLGNDVNNVHVFRQALGNTGIVSGHEYQHYNTIWKVGNKRGGSDNTLGYAFELSTNGGGNTYNEKVLIQPDSNIVTSNYGSADQWNAKVNQSQLDNYLPLSGGNLTQGGIIDARGNITIQQSDVGGNASGIWWDDIANTDRIAGIGTLTNNGEVNILYMGWGATPWQETTSLSVSDSLFKYKNRNIWHEGNFDPNTKVNKAGDTMTGALNIKSNTGIVGSFKGLNNDSNFLIWRNFGDTKDIAYIGADGNSAVGGGGGDGFGIVAPSGRLQLNAQDGVFINGATPWTNVNFNPDLYLAARDLNNNALIAETTYPNSVTYHAGDPATTYFQSYYGTSLHIKSNIGWYNRLDFPTNAEKLFLSQGINTTNMSLRGYIPIININVTNWDSTNFNPSSKANALENATGIGFSAGEYPTLDGGEYPYMYHGNSGSNTPFVALATQEFTNANYHKINHSGSLANQSDSNVNKTWFDYSWAGSGSPGSVINFSGLGGYYATELFGEYGNGGNRFGLRTRNGDAAQWNDPRWIWHSGNFNPASYVTQSSLNTQLGNYATLNGVQTFNNTNTFNQSPVIPNGTLGNHAVNLNQLLDVAPPYHWNYVGQPAITNRRVLREMTWNNYGNGHTIFDISSGTTPWGASKSNVDAEQPWTPSYPTLVGGNGSETYGVRVDSARNSDNLGGISAGNYATQVWVNTNFIPKSHPVFNITQANINSWNAGTGGGSSHTHFNLSYLNNIDQYLGTGQAPQFGSVRLMDNLGYGLIALEEDLIGGEVGLVDLSNDRFYAGRINEYLKYGSSVNGFEGLNIHFDAKLLGIGREIGNDEDKVQLAGDLSVDTVDFDHNSRQLVLNPLYNADGDVRRSRNAHIYIVTRNPVRLPDKPILGQRIEIFNDSDSDIEVTHGNVGTMFKVPAFCKVTGIAANKGFRFDAKPVDTKQYDI
ncbi:hypothetical protein [Chryseobacterium scophthalmum]|uniref:Uncharacterized protein n=1 Tax=Chryseobacterium scophthalmum TaxID=59733 RepID=A0A1N6FCH9_9FLAO|nr:hypothetical protein [Chryseobacterium scophthalmum]SIN92957.1 hypothetical protein SAMN05421769_1191 [Chryseobacterium scophthalmum]